MAKSLQYMNLAPMTKSTFSASTPLGWDTHTHTLAKDFTPSKQMHYLFSNMGQVVLQKT